MISGPFKAKLNNNNYNDAMQFAPQFIKSPLADTRNFGCFRNSLNKFKLVASDNFLLAKLIVLLSSQATISPLDPIRQSLALQGPWIKLSLCVCVCV